MARHTPSARAEHFSAYMSRRFPAIKPLKSPNKIISAFIRASDNFNGHYLTFVQEDGKATNPDGTTLAFLLHLVWFEEEGYEDAFCALLYLPHNGEYGFTTNDEPDTWHDWLDTEAKRATAVVRLSRESGPLAPPHKLN